MTRSASADQSRRKRLRCAARSRVIAPRSRSIALQAERIRKGSDRDMQTRCLRQPGYHEAVTGIVSGTTQTPASDGHPASAAGQY